MSLENLTNKYKDIKEKLRSDFASQVEYLISVGERLISVEKNIDIITERSEKRLSSLEKKIENIRLGLNQLTQDIRSAEDRIRDIE